MKYVIEDRFHKVGEVILQDGMVLRKGDTTGPCELVFGKLYIYPATGDRATLVPLGEDVEVLSEQRNMRELEKRKDAIVFRQLSWQEQRGEENTRSFDPSNESW